MITDEHDRFYPALAKLAEELERKRATYVLVGGLAVGLWLRRADTPAMPRLRTTRDIDLGASRELAGRLGGRVLRNAPQVVRLELHGATVDVIDLAPSSGAGLEGGDVLVRLHPHHASIAVPGHDVSVRVLRPAPLVVMKAVAYANNRERRRDLVDVAALAIADFIHGTTREELATLISAFPELAGPVADLGRRFDDVDAPGSDEYARAVSPRQLLRDEPDDADELRERASVAVRRLLGR